MNVWLIKDGENLPIQPDPRKFRMWMLADALLERGHTVTWWASTFSHQHKSLLYHRDFETRVKDGFTLKLLYSGAYRKSMSFRRVVHHLRLAHRFKQEAEQCPKPDVIVCSFPIIDTALEAVKYGERNNVPVIVDIRDPWPVTLTEKFSGPLKRIMEILVTEAARRARYALKNADCITAVSHGLLSWGATYAKREKRENDRVFYIGYPRRSGAGAPFTPRMEGLKQDMAGKLVFTFIGIFGSSYELELLCDAAEVLQKKGYDRIHFALGGYGDKFQKISRRARSLSNMVLLGWLDSMEIENLLDMTYVGIAPCRSVDNIVPNKVFEYFSAGLPILSSLKGEMEDIISRNGLGFSYPCGDLDSLVAQIIRFAEDEGLRKQVAGNVPVVFNKEFAADTIYRKFAEHVEKIRDAKALRGAAVEV